MGKRYFAEEASPQQMRVVQTIYGKVLGEFYVENGITIYKGVPYAKPPVGDLRWAAPMIQTLGRVFVPVILMHQWPCRFYRPQIGGGLNFTMSSKIRNQL